MGNLTAKEYEIVISKINKLQEKPIRNNEEAKQMICKVEGLLDLIANGYDDHSTLEKELERIMQK